MAKIKLVDDTIINISEITLENGILKFTTTDLTVEELAALFKDTTKTNLIIELTDGEEESGFKSGFTSFAGISYNEDGSKTIQMFQPVDATESRIANAEGAANLASSKTNALSEETAVLAETIDNILTEVIPNMLTE